MSGSRASDPPTSGHATQDDGERPIVVGPDAAGIPRARGGALARPHEGVFVLALGLIGVVALGGWVLVSLLMRGAPEQEGEAIPEPLVTITSPAQGGVDAGAAEASRAAGAAGAAGATGATEPPGVPDGAGAKLPAEGRAPGGATAPPATR